MIAAIPRAFKSSGSFFIAAQNDGFLNAISASSIAFLSSPSRVNLAAIDTALAQSPFVACSFNTDSFVFITHPCSLFINNCNPSIFILRVLNGKKNRN